MLAGLALAAAVAAGAPDALAASMPVPAEAAAPSLTVGGPAVTVTAPARLPFSVTGTTTVFVTFGSWTFPDDGTTVTYLTTSAGKKIGASQELNGSGPWSPPPYRLARGRYDLVLKSADHGSATLRLTAAGTIHPGGAAVPVTLRGTGQPVLLAFEAKAGTTLAAVVSGSTFTLHGGAALDIEDAAGDVAGQPRVLGLSSEPVAALATVPKTGTYYVAVRPVTAGATGRASLMLRLAPAPVPVRVGGPAVTVTVRARGLPATATFRLTAAAEVAVLVHATTFHGYTARLYITKTGFPAGAYQYLNGAPAVIGSMPLPAAGSYSVMVDPGPFAGTGSVTFSLVKITDLHLRTTLNAAAIPAVIKHPAQRAFIAFAAKTGQTVTVSYARSSFRRSSDTIALDGPGGAVAIAPVSLTAASGSLGPVKLAKTGTYTVVVDPSFTGDTGRISVAAAASAATASTPAPAASAAGTAAAHARPALPGTSRPAATGPSFSVLYTADEYDAFYFGELGFAFQGYWQNSYVTATWTGSGDGAVSGSVTGSFIQGTWLYDDACIIARLSGTGIAGGTGGALAPGELFVSRQPNGSLSYTIAPEPMYYDETGQATYLEFDTDECISGLSQVEQTVSSHIAIGAIHGSVPAGQTSVTGFSACGAAELSGSPEDARGSYSACFLAWRISGLPAH